MPRSPFRRPSAATVLGALALFVALGGTGYALSIPRNSVGTSQLKGFAVTNPKLGSRSVSTLKLGPASVTNSRLGTNAVSSSKVANDTILGTDVKESTLATVPSAARVDGLQVISARATASAAGSVAAARAAAPKIPLAIKGPLSFYGKCFTDSSPGGDTMAEVYAQTSVAGALIEAQGFDEFPGGNGSAYLLPTTLETDSQVATQTLAAANSAGTSQIQEVGAITAEGATVTLHLGTAVKAGTPPQGLGNGPFGAGNVCLFYGSAIG